MERNPVAGELFLLSKLQNATLTIRGDNLIVKDSNGVIIIVFTRCNILKLPISIIDSITLNDKFIWEPLNTMYNIDYMNVHTILKKIFREQFKWLINHYIIEKSSFESKSWKHLNNI
jgi:hypothetical protein